MRCFRWEYVSRRIDRLERKGRVEPSARMRHTKENKDGVRWMGLSRHRNSQEEEGVDSPEAERVGQVFYD